MGKGGGEELWPRLQLAMNVLSMKAVASTSGGSKIKLVLWPLILLLCVLAGFFAMKYTTLKLSVAFADGQIRILDEMKASADVTADPHKLSGQLEYVLNYYPSGSKQETGSKLDRVVESARSNAIAAIIDRLRSKTGKDLGNDLGKWLKEYPPSAN